MNSAGQYSVCMYVSKLESWDFPEQSLTDIEREEIRKNLSVALEVMNLEAEIE
jgi:hypothetical protein